MTEPYDARDVHELGAFINPHVSGYRRGGSENLARLLLDKGYRRIAATAHTCTEACAHTVDPVTAAIATALAEHAGPHCVWRHREGPEKLATWARAAAEKAFLAAGWTPPASHVPERQ